MEENTPCIFERVYIETTVDTDHDGKYDLIAAYVRRPESTLHGEKVPALFVANPYLMTCNEDWLTPHENLNEQVKVYGNQNIPEEETFFDFTVEPHYEVTEHRETRGYAETALTDESVEEEFECISEIYRYFNNRGYASVFCGGLGTRGSEGYTMTGSREEVYAFKAVIDWLNGKARAFTNKEDNIEIKASWCTGNVGMSAKSYLGTLCTAVAGTGVEGLKTIVPEAAITSWYDYFRSNGLAVAPLGWNGDDIDRDSKYCFSRSKDPEDYAKVKDGYEKCLEDMIVSMDRDSGNYNRFWDERNFRNTFDNIRASVFIIHGLNDWNVKLNQCIPLFKAMEERGIEHKMMLHQGAHIYIYSLKDSHTLSILERWFDHYLKGVDNGIEKEPVVLVEDNHDQSLWKESDTWPPEGTEEHVLTVESKEIRSFTDNLQSTVFKKSEDNFQEWKDELILSPNSYSLNYQWPAQSSDRRLCGRFSLDFTAAIDQPTAIFSAMVVDYGTDCRLTTEQIFKDNEFTFGREEVPSSYKIITRGWMNAQNRTCNWSKEVIGCNEFNTYTLDFIPCDYTIKEGHKIGLVLYGIDPEGTQRPDTITKVTVKEDTIGLKLSYL